MLTHKLISWLINCAAKAVVVVSEAGFWSTGQNAAVGSFLETALMMVLEAGIYSVRAAKMK